MNDQDFDPQDEHDWSQEETYKSLSSYADLFSAISIVFLFLYIISSFQSNLMQISHVQEKHNIEKIKQEELDNIIASYKKIVATFEVERDNYLNNKISKEETEFYHDTLIKLSKLAEEKEAIRKVHEQQYIESKEKAEVAASFTHQLKQIIDSNIALKEKISKTEGQKDYLENNRREYEQQLAVKYEQVYQQKLQDAEQNIRLEQLLQAQKNRQEMYRTIAAVKQKTEDKISKNYEKEMVMLLEETGKQHFARYNNLMLNYKDQAYKISNLKSKLKEHATLTNKLTSSIENALHQAGVPASVDKETGEITLHFGQFYFEKNSSRLSAQMNDLIQKAIPIYAQKVFESSEMASKIDHFEIIGYSSPTYNKKYWDPKNSNPEHFQAVNYNMDLSYRRAKSIFQAIFDPKLGPTFELKEKMMKMTRVSGRSSLDARSPSSTKEDEKLTAEEYCQKYKCTEQQKVVIKFNLKD